MITKFSNFLNENNYFYNLRHSYLLYNDFISIFLEDKSMFHTNFLSEIFNNIIYNDVEKLKFNNVEEKENYIKQSSFYKDLENIWNKYKETYIENAENINKEVNKAMDKYNRDFEIFKNKHKSNIEKLKNIKKGIKRFGDLLIEYKTEIYKYSDDYKSALKIFNSIDFPYNDETRLLYITKYDLKNYPEPKDDEYILKEDWIQELRKYDEEIESWAKENNYYIWSF